MDRKRVGILVFPDVEILDFCGPFEVLVVAETKEPVVATGGLRVLPDHDLTSCPRLDILVVPGGWGTRSLVRNERVVGWIRERAGQAELAVSVCTGSFLYGQAGLLDGRRATTHWLSLDRMKDTYPAIDVVRDEHVVEDGSILTSAGIAAGIDMALRVVLRYHGEAVARTSARYMEYPYLDHNARQI